jgi:hypothetical protein
MNCIGIVTGIYHSKWILQNFFLKTFFGGKNTKIVFIGGAERCLVG